MPRAGSTRVPSRASRRSFQADELARFRQLRAWVALPGDIDQPRKIALRLGDVATVRGGFSRTVEAAETVGLTRLRGLELLERFTGPLELEQHVAEELARGNDAP